VTSLCPPLNSLMMRYTIAHECAGKVISQALTEVKKKDSESR
jgi:hypothetical protein